MMVLVVDGRPTCAPRDQTLHASTPRFERYAVLPRLASGGFNVTAAQTVRATQIFQQSSIKEGSLKA